MVIKFGFDFDIIHYTNGRYVEPVVLIDISLIAKIKGSED